jgi:crotonobetainyl-CoA:carnitine CoA-transferase CaiB-like acyl-CoA transferase
VVSGPSNHASDVITDPHVAVRHMLVEMERTDGGDEPVLVPGNPVKLSKVSEGPETRVPWIGEHTTAVLTKELGLSEAELAGLRGRGVIS